MKSRIQSSGRVDLNEDFAAEKGEKTARRSSPGARLASRGTRFTRVGHEIRIPKSHPSQRGPVTRVQRKTGATREAEEQPLATAQPSLSLTALPTYEPPFDDHPLILPSLEGRKLSLSLSLLLFVCIYDRIYRYIYILVTGHVAFAIIACLAFTREASFDSKRRSAQGIPVTNLIIGRES